MRLVHRLAHDSIKVLKVKDMGLQEHELQTKTERQSGEN